MFDLPSQLSAQPPSYSTRLPILTGPGNVASFLKNVHEILRSKFGEVGQNILNSTTTTLVTPGPRPHYSDPHLHPIHGTPLPNTRKYARTTMTATEEEDPTFDRDTLLLTEAGNAEFNQDTKNWHAITDRYHRLLDKHRANDDELLTLLRDHISLDALEVLRDNPLYFAFLELPFTCITRSQAYIKIITSQFSHGNSTVSINELTKFLTLTQGPPSSDSSAAFFNRLSDQYDRIIPLLDHATTLVQLKAMLLCMVAIKGLNKNHPPTLRALEIHFQTYPGNNALDHYSELRTSVLAHQDSDIANIKADVTSEQSSAFQATVSSPPTTTGGTTSKLTNKGQPIPGRTDYCGYCFRTFTKYWYHPETKCQFKRNKVTKLDGTKPPAKPTLTARLAELDAKIAAIPQAPSEKLSHDQVLSFLAAQGFQAQFEQLPPTI